MHLLQAAVWIAEDSCPEYMLKAEECLRQEEDRVQHYLHISTKPKLLEQVRSVPDVVKSHKHRLIPHRKTFRRAGRQTVHLCNFRTWRTGFNAEARSGQNAVLQMLAHKRQHVAQFVTGTCSSQTILFYCNIWYSMHAPH